MGTSHSIGRSSLSPQNLKDANPHFESALHPTRSSPHKKRTMAETKKESFMKYLESAGVIDSLTKFLVALYEEPDKPPNATSSIVQLLGGPSPEEYNALLAERDELADRLKAAEEELAQLKGEEEQ